ncbi:MAG: hypothetical protein ACE15D_18545 [Candidatus Eisenbacteria bacterium]
MRSALVLVLVFVFFTGCATTKPPQVYTPQFAFSAPNTAGPGSAGVTLAVVNAQYATDADWTSEAPFSTFASTMSSDFQALLNARGFTVRGPFRTVDEMTFPDKKGSDLVLTPTLELAFDPVPGSARLRDTTGLLAAALAGQKTYTAEVDYTVGGRVTLAVSEPLSAERMWFKSLPVETTTVHLTYRATGAGMADINLMESRELCEALSSTYASILDTAWKYLDPDEMAIAKKQSAEIRAKKVYD